MKYNVTTDFDRVVCAYPISGQYAILNRVLFYIVLAFGIFAYFKKWIWLIIATWAYVMTYSAATVLHIFIMDRTMKYGFYNLDFPAAWSIVSVASLTAGPLASFSHRLRNSRYRPIFIIWGTMVNIAGYCYWLVHDKDYPLEPACRSSSPATNGTLLTDQTQLLVSNQFDCTYKCFTKDYPTRARSEITVIPAIRAFGYLYKLHEVSTTMTFALSIFTGLFMIAISSRRRTREELIKAVDEPCPTSDDPDVESAWHSRVEEAREELATGKLQPKGDPFSLFCPLALPIVITFNELYIRGQNPFPESENAYAVGQWAPWVSVWVSLIAAGLNTKYKPRWMELSEEWEKHDQDVRGTTTSDNSAAASTNTTATPAPSSSISTTSTLLNSDSMTQTTQPIEPPKPVHRDPSTRVIEVQRSR